MSYSCPKCKTPIPETWDTMSTYVCENCHTKLAPLKKVVTSPKVETQGVSTTAYKGDRTFNKNKVEAPLAPNEISISKWSINPTKNTKTLVFFDVKANTDFGVLTLMGLRIMSGGKGFFVSEAKYNSKGSYYSYYFLPIKMKELIEKMALEKYNTK